MVMRVVSPIALRPMGRNRINRVILAAVGQRTVPLLHCHAHSLAYILPNRYPYKQARGHLTHFGNHDSSVVVLGKIGLFPVRVRGVLVRFGRLNDGCLVAVRAMKGGSRVLVRIRLDSLFASSCDILRHLAGRVAHRLGSRLLLAPRLGLITGNSLPMRSKGTIQIGSLHGLY